MEIVAFRVESAGGHAACEKLRPEKESLVCWRETSTDRAWSREDRKEFNSFGHACELVNYLRRSTHLLIFAKTGSVAPVLQAGFQDLFPASSVRLALVCEVSEGRPLGQRFSGGFCLVGKAFCTVAVALT